MVEKQIKMALRVSEEQKKILEAKARSAGYNQVVYYIRSVLFRSISTEEKIDAIYKKICNEKWILWNVEKWTA